MVNKKKKGKNAIVLLSHNLLEHQIEELERKWNVGNIIYLPEELQKRWSNVDPELEFYNKQGWDIVGQTCDPEATFARLNQLCYAGVAVQIDDPTGRADYIES